MSIDVQIEIRNTCLYDGGHFAVLMAMADCANTKDGDGIFPGMDLLAANARLKQRRTQDIVQELRNDLVVILQSDVGDDLGPEISPTGGRGRKTEYRIDLERVQTLQGLHEAEVEAGREKCHFCEARKKRQQRYPRKGAISDTKGAKNGLKGAISDVKGAIPGTHIRTHEPIEPSDEPVVASPLAGDGDLFGETPPPKPLSKSQILELAFEAYDQAAERLEWQACQSRNDTRRRKLAQRLEEVDGIDGWKAALEKAEASDFCMGRAPPRPGQPPFRMDIDFLLQQQSFVRLMEGKYDNREGSGSANGHGGWLAAAAGRAAANPD
jgi:hypothetical protein